jgi:hypothetical protein
VAGFYVHSNKTFIFYKREEFNGQPFNEDRMVSHEIVAVTFLSEAGKSKV